MGMWSDWYSKNAGKENVLTTAEFVLKAVDKFITDIFNTHKHKKSDITDFPASMAPTAHKHTKADITDFPSCLFPVGAQYIQYPSINNNEITVAFPANERPALLWPGTTWEKLWATEGIFFRTEGGQSSNLRTSGKQEDAIRNIKGSVGGGLCYLVERMGDLTGSGAITLASSYDSRIGDDGSPNATGYPLNFEANTGSSTTNPIAGHANGSDIRPVNRLFIIWKRIN
jgi:hypothetical protein